VWQVGAWKSDVVCCRAEQTLSLPCRERLWQAYLVFGFIAAAHVLLVLFTHWSVNVKCAVAFRACGNVQRATHCKVGALGAAAALPVLAAGDAWGRAARRCGDTPQGRLQGGATAALPPRNLLALAGLARPAPRAGRASPRTARPQLWCPGSAALLALCTWGGCEAPQGCAARRGAPQRPYGELFSSWRAKLGYKSRRPIFLPRPRICCCRAAVNGARRRGR